MYLGHVATCRSMIEYDRPPHIEYCHLFYILKSVSVCVSVCPHIPFRMLTNDPSVTDGKSIGDGWQVEFEFLETLCNITIKLFCVVSKIGHAEGGTVHASFAAWRSSALAININALESARRVLWCSASLERNRCGYTKLWGVPFENKSSNTGRKCRSKGGPVREGVIG